MSGNAWLWPDHVIGKRESRRLRDEHNGAVNACAEMVDLCKRAATLCQTRSVLGWTVKEYDRSWEAWEAEASAVIAKAERETR
jgi:3-mercaptopyruvate sulfurtransferase SseA